MNSSLMDIIRGKKSFSSEEIVGEIIKLENKVPEYDAAEQRTEEALLELRQAKIVGEGVQNSKLEEAEKNFEISRQEAKAIRSAVQNLHSKLETAIKNEIKNREAEVVRLKIIKSQKLDETIKKFSDCLVELVATVMLYQGPGTDIGFIFSIPLGGNNVDISDLQKRAVARYAELINADQESFYALDGRIGSLEMALREENSTDIADQATKAIEVVRNKIAAAN